MRTHGASCLYTAAILAGVLVGAISAAESPAQAGDWPHWLGPNRDGSSSERGLLREWPKEGPQVLWRSKIGQGWGCPSISGQDVFIHWTEAGNVKESVACLDSATGKERWKFTYPCEVYWKGNVGWAHGGVRATPCVTDKAVYALGVQGGLYCLDRKSGQALWNVDMGAAYIPASGRRDWKGFCMSPLLVDGRLIFFTNYSGNTNKEGESGLCEVVGLDASTGKEVWKYSRACRARQGGSGGQTPGVVAVNGESYVLFSADSSLKGLRAKDGLELKFSAYDYYRADTSGSTLATPMVLGDYVVENLTWQAPYIAKINFADANAKAQIVWREQNLCAAWPLGNFVHSNGCIFGFNTEKDNSSNPSFENWTMDLMCVDVATGKRLWTQKDLKFGYSLIAADGLLFVRTCKSLLLVEASPKGYFEKGRIDHLVEGAVNQGSDNGWVMPVLSRGCLYVRLPQELVCFKVGDDKLKPKAAALKTAIEPPKAAQPLEETKAQRLLRLAQEMEKAGQKNAARQSYEQIVKDFANDPIAALARERIAKLSAP